MADDTTLTHADLERLLSDYGAAYRFPSTPDIASAVERRLTPNGRTVNVTDNSQLWLGPTPTQQDDTPASDNDASLRLLGIPARPTRTRQILELAAGLLVFAIVAGLLVLIFRGVVPESENAPTGSTFVPDDSYALYISAGPANQGELLPLDPWTLADSGTLPRAESGIFGGTLSADGSTHVRIEHERESSDGENLPAEDVTIIVSDGLTRTERARFHPPAHVTSPHLSADGSRLAVRHRQGYGETISPTWYLLDTSDGSLIGTVSWERNDLPGNRVLISPDATRLYRASWQTVGALGPYHPELGSLTITSYDLTTGEELARREYTDIPAGGWALNPEAGEDSDIASYEPAVKLSPDGKRIVVAHADSEVVTLIGTDDLQIDRVISLSGSASWPQRLLTWTRIVPQNAAAKGAEFSEQRSAAYSPDGRYLYLWGIASEPDGGQIAYSGIGLWVVDLERGELVSRTLGDKRLELVQPAPDGEGLYVAWFKSNERPLTSGSVLVLQRQDARTLEVQAEREFVGYRRIVIDPTQDVTASEQEVGDAPGPLRVTTASGENGLEMRPIDATTLEPLPGNEPISLGHHYTHAFSPDGRTMAAIIWSVETGGAGWGGKLYLIDLTDWTMTDTGVGFEQNTGTLLYSQDGRALYWTLPTTTHPAHGMPRDYELYRLDLDTGLQETVAAFPSSFSPSELRIFRAGTRLAIWGPSVDPNNIVDGPPHVIIVDLEADEIAADIEIPNVKAWQHREDDDETLSSRIYQPGLAWDLDRELLYIAHADEERITVVDFGEGVVKIQSDIIRPRSLLDRFIDWVAPSAAAKSTPWTSKQAVLSPDGSRLYVAGRHEEFTETDDGEIVRTDATDLVIVDTERIEEVDRIDLGTIVGMQIAADDRHLLIRSYENLAYTTGHRLTKLDMDSGEIVDQLELPDLRSDGFTILGSQAVLRVTDGAGENYHAEELHIDLETFTVLDRVELDNPWYDVVLTSK